MIIMCFEGSRTTAVKSVVAVAVEFTNCSSSSAAVTWVGEMRLSLTRFCTENRQQPLATVPPTDEVSNTTERRQEHGTTHTARSCLVKECYRSQKTSKNHNRPQTNVARRSPEHSQHEKYPDLITASHLAQRSSPNGSLVHVLR